MPPLDMSQSDIETRKLEALSAISVAISTLGSSLLEIVRENAEQGRLLHSVDRKIDRLSDMVARLGKA